MEFVPPALAIASQAEMTDGALEGFSTAPHGVKNPKSVC
jgi:hypothetical protein